MDLIIQQPIPYKSLDFLQQYLRAYFTLTGEQKWRRFRLLFFLLTLKSAHHLLLSVYEPPTTTLKLLGNDLFRLTHLPPATNLVAVGTLAISGYYLYLIYFETMHTAMDFFAEVMDDRRRTTTFLISRYMPGKRGQTVSQYLKQYCFVVLIALQVFILAIGKSLDFSVFPNTKPFALFTCRFFCSHVSILRHSSGASLAIAVTSSTSGHLDRHRTEYAHAVHGAVHLQSLAYASRNARLHTDEGGQCAAGAVATAAVDC